MDVIKKIYSGFALLLAIILLTNGYSVLSASRNIERADTLAIVSEKRQAANELHMTVVQVQQWLTDISATRGLEGFDDGFGEAAKYAKKYQMESDRLKELYAGTEWVSFLRNTDSEFRGFYEMGRKMAQAYIDSGPEAGNPMMEQFDPFAEKMGVAVNKVVEQTGEDLVEQLKIQQNSATRNRFVAILMVIIAFVVGGLTAWWIGSTTKKSLSYIADQLMIGAKEVASASGQLSSSSQSLAEGATEQASSLEETSSSLEEISSMTKQNADHANSANSLMDDSKRMVDEGVDSMKSMITAMDSIKESSGEISKIIKVIEEIAFQTNLLALNAAVEAARAGEHGKGFAVVAEEVRNLAQRSATASKDTASLIENAVKKADEGGKIVSQSAKALQAIADSTKKVGDLVGEIAAASGEQSNGIDQVNKAVNQMDAVTQRNAASAEESASASEELSAQAVNMDELVSDLMRIVGGTASSGSKHSNRSVTASRTVKPIRAALPGLPKPARHRQGTVRKEANRQVPESSKGPKTVEPENVIPFDDDMKDF